MSWNTICIFPTLNQLLRFRLAWVSEVNTSLYTALELVTTTSVILTGVSQERTNGAASIGATRDEGSSLVAKGVHFAMGRESSLAKARYVRAHVSERSRKPRRGVAGATFERKRLRQVETEDCECRETCVSWEAVEEREGEGQVPLTSGRAVHGAWWTDGLSASGGPPDESCTSHSGRSSWGSLWNGNISKLFTSGNNIHGIKIYIHFVVKPIVHSMVSKNDQSAV